VSVSRGGAEAWAAARTGLARGHRRAQRRGRETQLLEPRALLAQRRVVFVVVVVDAEQRAVAFLRAPVAVVVIIVPREERLVVLAACGRRCAREPEHCRVCSSGAGV
jgi:hypothetical protein